MALSSRLEGYVMDVNLGTMNSAVAAMIGGAPGGAHRPFMIPILDEDVNVNGGGGGSGGRACPERQRKRAELRASYCQRAALRVRYSHRALRASYSQRAALRK